MAIGLSFHIAAQHVAVWIMLRDAPATFACYAFTNPAITTQPLPSMTSPNPPQQWIYKNIGKVLFLFSILLFSSVTQIIDHDGGWLLLQLPWLSVFAGLLHYSVFTAPRATPRKRWISTQRQLSFNRLLLSRTSACCGLA